MNTDKHRAGRTLDLTEMATRKLTQLAVTRAPAKAATLERFPSGVVLRLREATAELSTRCSVLSMRWRR